MGEDARRSERADLSVIVGMNIQRIATISELTVEYYAQAVLPYLGKHIELCEDDLAQEFILQSIIHTFPVEFHITTISPLFAMFTKVEQGVRILEILNQLLDRLLGYIGTVTDLELAKGVFVAIASNIEALFNAEGHLGLSEKFETLQRLLALEMKIDRENVRNVGNLMRFANYHIELSIGDDPLPNAAASERLRRFLEVPLTEFESGAALFEIPALPLLINRLVAEDKAIVATLICQKMILSHVKLNTEEEIQFFIEIAGTLVRDVFGKSCFFAIVHLIEGESVLETLFLLQKFVTLLGELPPKSAARSILPVGLSVLKLLRTFELAPEECAKLVQFVEIFADAMEAHSPANVLMLYVETAKVLEAIGDTENGQRIAMRGLEILPELEQVSTRARMLNYLINFVTVSTSVSPDVNAPLCNVAAGLAGLETTRAVATLINCAALFWRRDGSVAEPGSVQACLAKATRIANSSAGGPGLVLHGFYLVLAALAYWLLRRVGIDQKWVRAVIGAISEKHSAITATGSTVEKVVGSPVKVIYVSAAKVIQDYSLLQPETEEEDDDEEEEEHE
jgi:hypothetical protein